MKCAAACNFEYDRFVFVRGCKTAKLAADEYFQKSYEYSDFVKLGELTKKLAGKTRHAPSRPIMTTMPKRDRILVQNS
jgi:hypothetical protein